MANLVESPVGWFPLSPQPAACLFDWGGGGTVSLKKQTLLSNLSPSWSKPSEFGLFRTAVGTHVESQTPW